MDIIRTQINNDGTTTIYKDGGFIIIPCKESPERQAYVKRIRSMKHMNEQQRFIYTMKKYGGVVPESLRKMENG